MVSLNVLCFYWQSLLNRVDEAANFGKDNNPFLEIQLNWNNFIEKNVTLLLIDSSSKHRNS